MFKLNIQLFIEDLFKSLLTILRVFVLSKRRGRIIKDFENQACVILGNGPSLSKSITDNHDFLKGEKLLCANNFPVVDHSWIPEISVDEDNRVLINQKHFYDDGKTSGQPMGKLGRGERKLHEVLQRFLHTFEGYFTIKAYAEHINAKIYNCKPGPFIDAFERLRLHKKEN